VIASLLFSTLWTLATAAEPPADAWQATIDRVSTGVVSIQMERVRAFDNTWYANSQATGFVVDAERGLILTNRHVVSPGPVVAEAVFLNGEEVALEAVYRDPVHDFGLFRYDPDALRHLQPATLPLAPEAAQVGVAIRVIGNDAGEKISILAGTLARLDRAAPWYGRGEYNDFNTFYLQAASSTSGGSSGSPVVDVKGRVVGLNAGSNRGSASSFYLPLDRVVRAVELIRRGEPVSRGTLQTTFVHKRYDELRRLGLRAETEAAARKRAPDDTGLLVVDAVLPGSASAGVLLEGDILVGAQGQPITGFVALEALLDGAVGQRVKLSVERGGVALELELEVADLHGITPSSYLEFGRGVVHDLSYQQARSYNLPLRGVYVADNGYLLDRDGVPYKAVVIELDGRPVPDLDAFQAVLATMQDGYEARVRYFMMEEPERERVTTLRIDRRWFPVRRCEEAPGPWTCTSLPAPDGRVEPEGGSTTLPRGDDARTRTVISSLVKVDFDVPYTVDGTRNANFVGPGVIVDAERGLVVTDRNTVPITLGDAHLIFANDLEIPAEVVLVHPFHGMSLLRYDPALIGSTPVASARWDGAEPEVGERVWWVGYRADGGLLSKELSIEQVDPYQFAPPSRPRFIETNLAVARVDGAPVGGLGVLADRRGQVRALWGSLSYDSGDNASEVSAGLPTWLFDEVLAAHDAGEQAVFRSLDVELGHLGLVEARALGLPETWVRKLVAHDEKRRVLSVRRLSWGSPAAEVLRGGDLLLAIDDRTVTGLREVELAVADGGLHKLTVLRDGAERVVEVMPRTVDGAGVERVVVWAGAFLQETPLPAQQQQMAPAEGVYVDLRWRGGPAMRYELPRGARILAVDEVPTPDLDAFLAAVAGRADRSSVRLTTMTLDRRREVVTLKLDLVYWPTGELVRTSAGWERREL
jgi:S1-C subfamily serine protease